MNKRHLHHIWTKLLLIKPRYFLILTLVSALVCVMALRANNEHMLKLRTAVYNADKAGTDVELPLKQLQAYVTSHMNTNLSTGPSAVYPPIQLKYTYQRLVQAQTGKTISANSPLYTAAQAYCEAQNSVDFSGHNRVPCIEQYVQSHGASVQAPTTTTIPVALYEFSFFSPTWSPDLGGWSLVATIICSLLFIASLVAKWWFKLQLH